MESALKKKGFVLEPGDHRYYTLFVDGQRTHIMTFVSRGTGHKQIGSPLIAEMAKQMKLSKKEFLEFVECRLSHASLVAKLRELGEI